MPYPGITFRPARLEDPEDMNFLYRVFASTRMEELSVVDWTPEQLEDFLQMQFYAQHKYYQEHFTKAAYDLILLKEHPIGRLYLDRRKGEMSIIDIALLPEHRGKGIGRALMEDILAEGQTTNRKVCIHVEKNNPALRLYNRLGFKEDGEVGPYYYMEWRPEPNNSEG